jgi:cyclopropane-fatty-acyl-phospholipid synthase
MLARAARAATFAAFARMHSGTLTIELPDGTERRFGGRAPGPDGRIRVRRHRFFARLAGAGALGLGESFVDGDWDTPDLTALIRVLAVNRDRFPAWARWLGAPGHAWSALTHRRRRNTRRGSLRNVQAHYDQGNDFFRLFLDPSMTYSCAIYGESGETLEQAQRRKLDAVLRKARVGPGDEVLEIGSGWGSFAIHAARTAGCRVTGITLSTEQLALSRVGASEAGLGDRVTFELCDYRDVQGRYDAIVSIEMIEAVGHEYLGAFFGRCDDLLKPRGRVVLQAITIGECRYAAYRRSADWIQKHVFPGGHLPSVEAMARAMERHSGLVVRDVERIGQHYATTLREWREALVRRRDDALRLGADSAGIRKWAYYFSYCEAGFLEREIDDVQLVLVRDGEA